MLIINTFLALLFCFVLLPLLKKWVSIHIQGVAFILTGRVRLARWIFWLILLPGTFLHEISHWLTATILLVKTHRFSLWPKIKPDGSMEMGAVHMEGRIDPFRHSLIGLAPLIFGSMAILMIGEGLLGLDEVANLITAGRLDPVLEAVGKLVTMPLTWLYLYLIFSISNSMLPSTSDRRAWLPALLYIAILLLITLTLGYTPTVSPLAQDFGFTVMASLLSAFIITILVDLLFIALIASLELLLSWVMGRQVVYNR